ncbi:hypothetical protein AMTR_s00119p00086060 [Amborella trichopoda]|uniref:Uncharacterized protein n=1 Tax=Amborella trichopoda TaxID=13333 RepID=W1NNI7_AMBTC|nr:hypothetical protein AMTR_s00119p00086060 [Amborella trichopoda]
MAGETHTHHLENLEGIALSSVKSIDEDIINRELVLGTNGLPNRRASRVITKGKRKGRPQGRKGDRGAPIGRRQERNKRGEVERDEGTDDLAKRQQEPCHDQGGAANERRVAREGRPHKKIGRSEGRVVARERLRARGDKGKSHAMRRGGNPEKLRVKEAAKTKGREEGMRVREGTRWETKGMEGTTPGGGNRGKQVTVEGVAPSG